jgi:UDP-glucose 4-epimerase
MRVLIVGGAGFVGLNLAAALLARGHRVTLFDLAAPPDDAWRVLARHGDAITVVRGDVTDRAAAQAAVAGGADALVLGAAITADAARDATEPERILAVNLLAQVPLLEAARRAGLRRVINLSSAAAYGAAGQHHDVLEETTPADPVSLYAITKFASERVAARLAELCALPVVSVRLSGVFGPWERAGGLRDTPSPQALIVDCLRRGAPALLDDPGVKDWVYAPDVAAAVTLLIEADRPRHGLYNISSGETYAAAAWGARLAALHPGFVCRLAAPGERATVTVHGPARAPLAVNRLAEEFGWRAAHGEAASAEHLAAWLRETEQGS